MALSQFINRNFEPLTLIGLCLMIFLAVQILRKNTEIRESVEKLHTRIDSIIKFLKEWCKEMADKEDRRRILEYLKWEAYLKMKKDMAQRLKEIFELEKNIELIKKSIEKELFMKVTQTRLENRTRRPNTEAWRDPVQHRLEAVFEISEAVDRVKAKVRETENALLHLVRTKLFLEYDLSTKNKSLY